MGKNQNIVTKIMGEDEFMNVCEKIQRGEQIKSILTRKEERSAFFAAIRSSSDKEHFYRQALDIGLNWALISVKPTKERLQHDGGVRIVASDRNNKGDIISARAEVSEPHVLDWYFNKGSIDKQMLETGHKFHRLFFYAGKMPRTTVMWRERIQKSFSSIEEYQEFIDSYTDAQKELLDALKILSSEEQDVVWEVAGLCKHAGTPARTQNLKTGLRALAVHWKIYP